MKTMERESKDNQQSGGFLSGRKAPTSSWEMQEREEMKSNDRIFNKVSSWSSLVWAAKARQTIIKKLKESFL